MHALSRPDIVEAIAAAVSAHVDRRWTATALVDLGDRASHPCAILRGDGADGLDVFAKLSTAVDGVEQFDVERRGLLHVQRHAGVLVPTPIGAGVVAAGDSAVLVLEALPEIAPSARGVAEWRSIGGALAQLHGVTAPTLGLDGLDGFFGPLRQPNDPVAGGWASFFRERRIEPFRAAARASGHLPRALDQRLDRLVDRLPALVGPEPAPSLLHGDAQQHNFLSTPDGAALIDVSPYFGHPEVDLAMLDIFRPVPGDVLDGYREVRPIADDAGARVELWRLPAYLAVIAVDGANPFGRSFVPRLADALEQYGA